MSPSRLLIALALLMALPLFLAPVNRNIADVGLVLNLVLLAAAIVDFFISPSPRVIEVHRDVADVLSVATRNPTMLRVKNRSGCALRLTIDDEPGPLAETVDLPQTLLLQPWKEMGIQYGVIPLKRGENELGPVYLTYPTRWRLWNRRDVRQLPSKVKVYPDIRAVHRYDLLARQNRLAELGVRTMRMPGQGREFERLREFRYGDETRHIDWKATSRQRTLVTREFNVERNQNIVIMIDCGRFMRNESDGVSYLDRALNSAIMLAYIALGQGDNVSLLAFSNKIERFIRPVRGKPGIQSILRSTYDIQVSQHAADYPMALEYLARVQRNRALVLLITFITDELQLDVIGESLRLKTLPYLPLCVLLQDEGLRDLAHRIPDSDLHAYHTAAAAQILGRQAAKVATLRDAGIMIIDTPPQLLTERLINEYLNIKMRGLI